MSTGNAHAESVNSHAILTSEAFMGNSTGSAPALSIVITTWNRADMVTGAIESALAQDCPECLEVVVFDDGSTDETQSILNRLQQRPLPPNRMLRVIRGDHQGRSGAAQRGIDAAAAPYVALLSSDDRWEPQRAHELLTEEWRLGGDALIHTDWKEIDIREQLMHGSTGAHPPQERVPFEYTRASDGAGVLRQYVTSALRRHCFASCSSMFPRGLLTGMYALQAGMATPDVWVALAGYLRCKVAYLDVTSLRRTIHASQQHRLAEANLWPGLVAEQVATLDAIIQLLMQTIPGERSMIYVMRAKRRLLMLRGACSQQGRSACLAGSLALIPAALAFPALWITVLSNVLLAISPRLHDAVRYSRPRRRLAEASMHERSTVWLATPRD